MPYNSISALPQAVQHLYSKRCQKVFLEAWNANYKRNQKDSLAFEAGHVAAKNCEKSTK